MADSPKPRPESAVEIARSSSDDLADNRRQVFRRLLSYIAPYRSRLFWGIFFGILAGLVNGVFLLVIQVALDIIIPAANGQPLQEVYYPLSNFPILQNFEVRPPTFIAGREWLFALIIALSLPCIMLIRGVFQYLHAYCMLWINMKVLYRLRDESFSSLMSQSLNFFNQVKQGELIQTVANQTRTVSDAGSQLLSGLIQYPVAIVAIIATALALDPLYTLAAITVFPLCILPVALISRKVRKAGGKEEEESEGLMVTLHESFSGVRLVKAHGREEYQRERFNQGNGKIVKFIMRWRKAMEISSPMVEIVAAFGVALGMVYAFVAPIDTATFATINLGLISIYPHAKALSRMQIQVQKCFVAAHKVFSYIDAEPEVKDKIGASNLENCQGDISLENVTFSYVKDKAAITNVSLNFEQGKRYALVGQSGSGKSTILSLVLRFYDPESGTIRVDGKDIRDFTQQSLRDQIGIVSQDTFLFHDTILNNIRYGLLDATEDQIVQAAKLAHAHEFILEQEKGYDTILGDKGCTLSGGQQQRLSIARAILRDAPILFLDEAYSALDSESEQTIQKAVNQLSQGKTVIAIAHRLSTVLDSDEIIVLKNGRVIDQAPHALLLERCEEYQRLYHLQFEEA